jgi:outer membrane protein
VQKITLISWLVAGAFCQPAFAAGENDFRLQWVKSSETDLTTAVFGDYNASPESTYAIAASWGRQFRDQLFGLPIAMTANLGAQYFNERGYQSDGFGATAYVKALYSWQLPRTEKRVRLGLGEGLSYVSHIPVSEQRDFAKKGVESVHVMNYVEWTVDVPLRQFAAMDNLLRGRFEEVYVGFIVWHRSTVYGLFGDARGGINFMGFGFEAQY